MAECLSALKNKITRLRTRAGLFSSIRRFFDARDFLEVESAIRIHAPAPEEYIECIGAEGMLLRSSPELEMKTMLAAGYEKIYQIGSCFRQGEYGRKHREEFTMLEWYEVGSDYVKLRDFVTGFIRQAAEELLHNQTLTFKGMKIDLSCEPEVITVEEAFRKYAQISCAEAEKIDQFDEIMVCRVEPNLGRGRLTYLCDYPANRAALARLKKSNPEYAERWELYINGLELANAYGELIDPAEQRRRFDKSHEFRRAAGMKCYPDSEYFYEAIAAGSPECVGAAMGLDRLAMVFTDAEDIGEVRVDLC